MSRHLQLSLLGGSSQHDPQKRYRPTRYDFGSGAGESTQLFAQALLQHHRPECVVILGTSGSMWDVLLEAFDCGEEDFGLELIDAAQEDGIAAHHLNRLATVLETALGLRVRLRLIPYGRTAEEQLAILQQMAADIEPRDRVNLDVTHGLRHLPMLAQMSALYLRQARQVHIEGIYYGALDMSRDGVTPVMDLKGLLDIADWVGALHTFDKDGDYGVFQSLLAPQDHDTATALGEAAFFERTMRAGQARGQLRAASQALDRQPLSGMASLFEPTLRERINWMNQQRLYQRQRALALQFLQRGDYLRACVYAVEAFITLQAQLQGIGNAENAEVRSRVKDHFETHQRKGTAFRYYRQLRGLRNKLAHGDQAQTAELQLALSSAAQLDTTLRQLINQLLPVE